jgi:phenylpropionate dioxygenase-like ring-hydroxylating dioxygenase large terminal subunit
MSQIMQRFSKEIDQYKLSTILPSGDGYWTEEVAANWKCVRDVDNEGYHVPLAHPGLHDLFGANYHDEPLKSGTSKSIGSFRTNAGRQWSVRNYVSILDPPKDLDKEHQKAWLYIGVFPNLVFGLYPDSVIFYQEFPLEQGKTIQRGNSYRHANENRRMRLSRYLSKRIDRMTSKEDEQLIQWSWEAAFSSGFDEIILSDLEYGVHSYHNALREFFPILNGDEPTKGGLVKQNSELLNAKIGQN